MHPESEEDFEKEPIRSVFDEEVPIKDRDYGKKLAGFDFNTTDLSVSDSKKFGGNEKL